MMQIPMALHGSKAFTIADTIITLSVIIVHGTVLA